MNAAFIDERNENATQADWDYENKLGRELDDLLVWEAEEEAKREASNKFTMMWTKRLFIWLGVVILFMAALSFI